MKSRPLIIAFVMAAWMLPCAPAQAPLRTPTQAILRIEDQWLHARTAAEAARLLAPDFVGVSTSGVIETRAQRLARFRPAPQPPATTVHFEHLTVAFPAPGIAIATGQVVATGSHGSLVYRVTFSDTFCLRRNQWLAVHAQETLAAPRSR